MLKFLLVFFTTSFLSAQAADQKYELIVTKGGYEMSGNQHSNKVMVNGSIPAPLLEFTIGDRALINVVNRTDEETLILQVK